MAKGIDISIAADTRSAMSAINRGLLEPLEDVSEQLEQLGDDSVDAGRDLERGMRDAQRRTQDAKDEIRDLRDELNRAGRQGKNTGDDIRDGFRRAEDGAEEFRDEANSTAREAAASFDGSAESIADAFQEIAANAFSGFGPAGAVAGLAAAAGIGLAVAGFEAMGEEEQKSRERAAEWAQAYIEAGNRVLSAAQTTAKGLEIFGNDELYAKAKDNAKNWGVDVSVAVAAMAGETWALTAAQEALTDRQSKLDAAMETTQVGLDGTADGYADLHAQIQNGASSLSQLTGEMQAGQTAADEYSRFITAIADNTEGAISTVDDFGDRIVSLPSGQTVYIDAETGQATMEVDAIEQKIYGIPDGSATVAVTADTSDVDRAMRRLSGTTLKIGARIVTSGDGSWQ